MSMTSPVYRTVREYSHPAVTYLYVVSLPVNPGKHGTQGRVLPGQIVELSPDCRQQCFVEDGLFFSQIVTRSICGQIVGNL